MNVYGLTGGPGCGKSAVSAYLREKASWRIYDADAVCHDLYSRSSSDLTASIAGIWGNAVLSADGTVNRKALASAVFGKPDELEKLNALVHPAIRGEIRRRIADDAAQSAEDSIGILDAALLFETNWDEGLSGTIAVWTSPSVQWARLRGRSWSEDECRRRIAAQLGADEKLRRADFGVINTGSFSFLYSQCDMLIQKLQNER